MFDVNRASFFFYLFWHSKCFTVHYSLWAECFTAFHDFRLNLNYEKSIAGAIVIQK